MSGKPIAVESSMPGSANTFFRRLIALLLLNYFFATVEDELGLIGSVVSISMALQDINKWYFAAYGIVTTLSCAGLFIFLIKKVNMARMISFSLKQHVKVFEKTHNSWHMYKRLIDAIAEDEELDLDEFLSSLRLNISNLISNFREAIIYRHPFATHKDFRVSLKLINYKNIDKIDINNKKSYLKSPFILKDIPYYRDTSSGPIKKEDIIDKIDFDENTNPKNIEKLKQSLFYESFINKKVAFVDKFSEAQQELTKIYKSGIVAPVVLHEIPLAFLCVGTANEGIFDENDRQLVCTFVDALAEYFRLERSLSNMLKSRKVIVLDMDKDITLALHSLIENKLLLQHNDKNPII